MRGKVYKSCVRSVMLYGSETWGTKDTDLLQLQRNDRAMIRWICGTKVSDKTPSVSLLEKLGIEDIEAALKSRRLRWYGHVQRATSCIKAVTNLAILGKRRPGRPRTTWSECVRKDKN